MEREAHHQIQGGGTGDHSKYSLAIVAREHTHTHTQACAQTHTPNTVGYTLLSYIRCINLNLSILIIHCHLSVQSSG